MEELKEKIMNKPCNFRPSDIPEIIQLIDEYADLKHLNKQS